MRRYLPWLAVAALLVALLLWNPRGVVTGAVARIGDFVVRGPRLNKSTLDSGGNVQPSSDVLVDQAAAAIDRAVDLEMLALARMVRSEADADVAASTSKAKELRAHVAYNDAADHGWGYFETVTK